MRIKDLTAQDTVNSSDAFAIDTGTVNRKVLWSTIKQLLFGSSVSVQGNVHLYNDSGGCGVYSHFNGSSAATAGIAETSNGTMTATGALRAGNFQTYGYEGSTYRTPTTSGSTDGMKVAYFYCNDGNTLGVRGQWGTTGNTWATKLFTASSSDKRLKKNIKLSKVNALEAIRKIKVRAFDWKSGGHWPVGMIADELETVDPLLVIGGGTDSEGNEVYKAVDTFYLEGYLVKAVQELAAENEALKKRLEKLEG